MKRDIAIIICSRGREDYLWRLLEDIDRSFAPALEADGLSVSTFVYAQGYTREFLDALEHRFTNTILDGRFIIAQSERAHNRIGDVFLGAITALHARLDYRLAMLMDDDSLYREEPRVDANLVQAARDFLHHGDRAYSIKLGQSRSLEYWPFINPEGPVMPFKEKMLWVSRDVLEEALALPNLAEISVGEDAVLSALAWRGGAQQCYGVLGIATFLHLGFESDKEEIPSPIGGGYGELVGYGKDQTMDAELGKYGAAYRSGVVPFNIMPEIFVGPEHPLYYINGIKPEAVLRFGVPGGQFGRIIRSG